MNPVLANEINVYLVVGSRRVFAAAVDWPGWCRMGRDETAALQNLFDYRLRYARILRTARLGFQAPGELSAFVVIERLQGNATTDFGAPDRVPARDTQPLDEIELRRLQAVLRACWRAFDAAVQVAEGKPLRTGPRGGGRDLEGIVQHVYGAEMGYLARLGGKVAQPHSSPSAPELIRQAILETLEASARGEIAASGPRGGKRWPTGFFIRREAWHVLDHVWEIEDRLVEPGE